MKNYNEKKMNKKKLISFQKMKKKNEKTRPNMMIFYNFLLKMNIKISD